MKTVMMMAMSFAVLAGSNAFAVGNLNGLDPNMTPGKAAQVAGEKPCQYAAVVAKNKNTNQADEKAGETTHRKVSR